MQTVSQSAGEADRDRLEWLDNQELPGTSCLPGRAPTLWPPRSPLRPAGSSAALPTSHRSTQGPRRPAPEWGLDGGVPTRGGEAGGAGNGSGGAGGARVSAAAPRAAVGGLFRGEEPELGVSGPGAASLAWPPFLLLPAPPARSAPAAALPAPLRSVAPRPHRSHAWHRPPAQRSSPPRRTPPTHIPQPSLPGKPLRCPPAVRRPQLPPPSTLPGFPQAEASVAGCSPA